MKKLNDVLDGPAILNRVNEIDSTIREHADEAVRARRLNTPVVEAMRTAGVFRMAMPAAWVGRSWTSARSWKWWRGWPEPTPRRHGARYWGGEWIFCVIY